ncbi:Gfo/Idh/MocA family oxidoreductase [candidate division KSB1 bacterium]|nr:Gfo/Idh/MocA family oxidoreductase [candidate division KSB1 bacterium]
MVKKIRLGIIGAGKNVVKNHLPRFQEIPEVEITCVCNQSRLSSEKVAQKFKIPIVYDHWKQLATDKEIEAVLIGTWPDIHCRAVTKVLQEGKHVLCSQLMAKNVREAQIMLTAAQAHPQLVTQLIPFEATMPTFTAVKRIIEEGHLGDILAVRISDCTSFLDESDIFGNNYDFGKNGYNILSVPKWYEIINKWIGEATHVTALAKTFVKTRKDRHGVLHAVRIPDHLSVLADMACGAQINFFISRVVGLAGPPTVFLFGNKGTLCLRNGKLYGGQKENKELKEISIPNELLGMGRIEQEFIDAILGREETTSTTFLQGYNNMEFTQAVSMSVAQHRSIPLPLENQDTVC